jgi:hypothetical protein
LIGISTLLLPTVVAVIGKELRRSGFCHPVTDEVLIPVPPGVCDASMTTHRAKPNPRRRPALVHRLRVE